MSPAPSFTDDDVGKRVETAAGETIGLVTMTEPETAYVDLERGAIDSTRAALDWEGDADDVVPIDRDAVRDVTAETVRLEGEAPPRKTDEDGTDPVIERNESTVHEDEGSEQRSVGAPSSETDTSDDALSVSREGRSGDGAEPETEEMEESGAERHPDEEDRPPQGDRTVTKERGEEEDR